MSHVEQSSIELPGPKERNAVIRRFLTSHVMSSNPTLLHCGAPVFYALMFARERIWKVGNVSGRIHVLAGAHAFINTNATVLVENHSFDEIRVWLHADSHHY